ncbi:MAG: crosslink repair DNA glycosylase YcaQ family protein [Candidatus Dormiibacterota bacterium]
MSAIERLAGMQAQYSPSPYIGLWTRLRDFKRSELEAALAAQLVFKATLMRGTLHLVSARQFDLYRIASRFPRHVWSKGPRQLAERGIDVESLREEMLAALDVHPLKKPELEKAFRHRIPDDLPDWVAFSVAATAAPVRFLPKWDNLLLAYDRRERVLPEALRKTVIRKNGDVLPTFTVDGMVAGAWEAPLRGRATITLTPFAPLSVRNRRAVEQEAQQLHAWLRPETNARRSPGSRSKAPKPPANRVTFGRCPI